MEPRRRKALSTRGSAATRLASLGKENICPSLFSREPVGTSRSPLPEGFPRAPLQDITHILSPINILPDAGDATELGPCRPCRKRSKCVGKMQTQNTLTRCDPEIESSEMNWSGLRKCASAQAAVRDLYVKGESSLTEGPESIEVEVQEKSSEVPAAALVHKNTHDIEMRETEHIFFTEILSMEEREIKTGVEESLSLIRTRKAMPRKPHKLNSSSPVTRANLRSAQQKPKMSSIMKFR